MFNRVSRRQFVQGAGALGLGLLAGCGRLPLQAQARSPTAMYRLGYLSPLGSDLAAPYIEALKQGLGEFGWAEGDNITLESRLAEGQVERLPGLAAELVGLHLDVIVAGETRSALAVRRATDTIPIVCAISEDPVGSGLVVSLAHPGTNITGVSNMSPQLTGKRVDLLKQAVPSVSHVAAIWDHADQVMAQSSRETLLAAQALGLDMLSLGVREPDDLDRAYETASSEGVDGIVVIVDPFMARQRTRLVELSARTRLPTISEDSTFAAAGGLMSYGPNFVQQHHRAAYYVDRILKGAKPADLPIEQPMTFDFVINLKTAQALGLTIPQEVMLQATEIVQ